MFARLPELNDHPVLNVDVTSSGNILNCLLINFGTDIVSAPSTTTVIPALFKCVVALVLLYPLVTVSVFVEIDVISICSLSILITSLIEKTVPSSTSTPVSELSNASFNNVVFVCVNSKNLFIPLS